MVTGFGYNSDDKFRKAKMQTLSTQFETLKMKEEEDVASYFLTVDEIVNSTTWLGDTIEEKFVVRKIMIILPTQFNPKVLVLEDISDLDDLTKDELYGILIAYEMSTKAENLSMK